MVAVTMTTPLPPAPQRGDGRDDFSDDADDFAEALTTYQIEQNQQASDLNDLAELIQALAASVVSSPNTIATSTASLSVSIASKTLNIETGKSIVANMWVALIDQTNPSRWMAGPVTSYDTGTGQLIADVQRIAGTGTSANWRVYGISPMLPDSAPRTLGAGSTVKDPGGTDRAIGYLGAPPIAVTTARILTPADAGRTLELFAGASITVPLNFGGNPGDIILLREMAGATKSITPAAGVTMRQSGTSNTGARTLKAYGEAAITITSTNNLPFISGDV